MSRHYTNRTFFRQIPNALLARYLERNEVLGDLDFGAMPEAKVDALFDAWMELPEKSRREMDAEFQEIFALSCEKGWRAIIDEAAWHLKGEADGEESTATAAEEEAHAAFVEKLAALEGHHERAMVTFLDHNELWKGATMFCEADQLPYWRKRKNMPRQPAATDEASVGELARLIGNYFHHVEGRGKNCVVEVLRRGSRDYYFAYPEDFSQRGIEWVDGEFDERPHTPAFQVVYVYSQEEGELDLNFRGSHKAVEPLQAMFVAAILKVDELPPDPKDVRIYDLDPLKRRDFEFIRSPESGIEYAAVKKLRLASWARQGDRITLESDSKNHPTAIHDLLEEIERAVSMDLYHVTQVEIGVEIVTERSERPKKLTIRLTHPNSCSLKYDEVDLRLRAMLEASGIEPKEPAEQASV